MAVLYKQTTIANSRVQPVDGVHILLKTLPEEQLRLFTEHMKGKNDKVVKIKVNGTDYYAVTFMYYYEWFSTWYEKDTTVFQRIKLKKIK